MALMVSTAIERAADTSRLVINPVIYAEASVRFTRIEELDAALPKDCSTGAPFPRGGLPRGQGIPCLSPARRNTPLAASGLFYRGPCSGFQLPVATRDLSRYRAYFPKLSLIAPD